MDKTITEVQKSWAIVELMGHLTLAGSITRPGEYGGLWQIDIPEGDSFRTEFFGSASVYRIRMVSEEIARAYVKHNQVIEYSAPIITRQEHDAMMERARERIWDLERQLRGLPAGLEPDDDYDFEDDTTEEEN